MKLKYKHIEASRELRLWIGQVVMPAVIAVNLYTLQHPEVKSKAKLKYNNFKMNIKNKFHK